LIVLILIIFHSDHFLFQLLFPLRDHTRNVIRVQNLHTSYVFSCEIRVLLQAENSLLILVWPTTRNTPTSSHWPKFNQKKRSSIGVSRYHHRKSYTYDPIHAFELELATIYCISFKM
jgi:hypothetical protein